MKGLNNSFELVSKIKRGDKKLLEQFYRDNRKTFFDLISRKYSVPKTEIADIYQESILILYRNIMNNKVDGSRGKLSNYLLAIGKNVWLTRMSKLEREKPFAKKFGSNEIEQFILNNISLDAPNEIPSEIRAVVLKTIDGMNDPCSKLLRLLLIHHYSNKEILKEMGYKSTHVLYTQKSRCLKKIQKIIQAHYGKDDF